MQINWLTWLEVTQENKRGCFFLTTLYVQFVFTDLLYVSGRSGLLNQQAIHKLRGLMLQCLYVLLKANHSGQSINSHTSLLVEVCSAHVLVEYCLRLLSWCSSAQPVWHRSTWQTTVSSSLMPARDDSARQIHWRVPFDVHGTLTAIGALLLPDHGSGILCWLNCNNVTLWNNSNGV